MRRHVLALAALLAVALSPVAKAQTIVPAPGCQAGVACQAGSLAVGSNLMYAGGILADGVQQLGWNGRATMSSPNAGTVKHGGFDVAAPIAQTITAQSVATGTSNTAAPNFTIAGPTGTGTGAGGSLVFQVAPAGTTGTNQNAMATALTIDSTKLATFGNSVVIPTAAQFVWTSRASIVSPGDGIILPQKGAGGQNTVATLAACTSGLDGSRSFVTDATAPTFGATVAGAGAVHIPVYCDGSGTPAWKVG